MTVKVRDFIASAHKDLRRAAEAAHEQGWTFDYSGKNHLVWISPNGLKVRSSLTPSAQGAIDAIHRDLYKLGLSIPGTKYEREETNVEIPVVKPSEANGELPVVKKALHAPMGSVQRAVLQAFTVHPQHGMSHEDLRVVLVSKGVKAASIPCALGTLKKKGMLENPEYGFWRLRAKPTTGHTAHTLPRLHNSAQPAAEPLEVLHELLAAMAKAEAAIRQLIEDQAKYEKIKEALK